MEDKIIKELSQEEIKILEFQSPATYRHNEARLMYGYSNPAYAFVADKVAPYVPVQGLQGQYEKINEDTFFNQVNDNLSDRSYPKEINWGSTFENYELSGYGLSVFLSGIQEADAVRRYGSKARWRKVYLELLATTMKLNKEKRILDFFTNSSNYATGYTKTLAANEKFDDYSTPSNPQTTVITAMKKLVEMGIAATAILPDSLTDWALRHHTKVIEAISGGAIKGKTKQAIVDRTDIARYFRIPEENYFVAQAVYNTTPAKSTPTMGRVMGDYMVVFHLNRQVTENTFNPSFIVQITMGALADIRNAGGWKVKSIRDERAGGEGGEWVQAWYYSQLKVHAQKLGYLIIDTLS